MSIVTVAKDKYNDGSVEASELALRDVSLGDGIAHHGLFSTAHFAAQGVRTPLTTCTNAQLATPGDLLKTLLLYPAAMARVTFELRCQSVFFTLTFHY